MTREEARKAAEVMLAYANGKEIEYHFRCYKDEKDWYLADNPTFDFQIKEYRVKPKSEKFDPKTLQPFDRVLVRDDYGEPWKCTFYSHKRENDDRGYKYATSDNIYIYCIPYNDDTKHLVGTTDEAPEFYRYWEE